MGANCCVAEREKPLPERTSCELSSYRNVRHSPSWSFRWDNRTHVEDIVGNPSRISFHNGGDFVSESLSDGGSPVVFRYGCSKSSASDQSTRSKLSTEGKTAINSSAVPSVPDANPSVSVPSPEAADPSTSKSCVLHPEPSPSGGSHGGSSDGWSMRMFTELVAASSKSEPCSSDSSNISTPSPPSVVLQTCRICSKLLKEKSPWSAQRIVSTNELPVAAVLVCGHVYHSECLESVTLSEKDRYDPPCPVCTNCEKLAPKLLVKTEQKARSRISRRAVADVDVGFGRSPSMGASSSSKGSFLRRHFSLRSPLPRCSRN